MAYGKKEGYRVDIILLGQWAGRRELSLDILDKGDSYMVVLPE